MSLSDTILDLATDTLTVNRRAVGSFDANDAYQPGAMTSFTITAVVQPAFNLNRVVGGADLHALVDLQKTTEVRQLHTSTELRTRTPTNDPDVIVNYNGASWTVIRVERWTLGDDTHYHCVISKQTGGAS